MTDLREIPWRLPVVLAVSLVATVLFHGTRGLFETTEGRYAECAREMAQSGSWLEPVLNGQAHWTKPPVTYLAILMPYKVLGATTWAARLYQIPCHLLTLLAVGLLACRLWRDVPSGRMCAMVYATAAMPMVASQTISTDYPLTASLAVAQAFFWEAVRKRSRGAVYLTWLSMGIAFLIKGPPSLLVLPAMVAVWLRLPRTERRSVPLFTPLALSLFLGVALSWYIWEAVKHPGLMDYWLKDEVVNRSLSDKYNRNPHFYQNFVIYLPVLLFGMLPWSGWLALRWRDVWAKFRGAGGGRSLSAGLSDEALWLVWATAFPLGVFMLSRSKLPLYVLPLFVPFAAAVGRLLMTVCRCDNAFRKGARVTASAALVIFVVGKAVMAWLPSDRDMRRIHRLLTEQCGVRDPTRLATFGTKPLNGLSYYYNCKVTPVPYEHLSDWANQDGVRYLLHSKVDPAHMRLAEGRVAEERVVTDKWRLVCITGPEEASKRAR